MVDGDDFEAVEAIWTFGLSTREWWVAETERFDREDGEVLQSIGTTSKKKRFQGRMR